jgi:hypothetical protein
MVAMLTVTAAHHVGELLIASRRRRTGPGCQNPDR